MAVAALPDLGIVETIFPDENFHKRRVEIYLKRSGLEKSLPAATAHAKWGAKIVARFMWAIGVVFVGDTCHFISFRGVRCVNVGARQSAQYQEVEAENLAK
ncbi:MAG: hypothetical protein IPN29_03065 [Saprospiraceae bacterium]|nr:hypothetical protein [Saprospiraceae bacterium]